MKVFQIGSTITDKQTPNDLDIVVVSNIPVDICLYTTEQWQQFKNTGTSISGHRVVLYPPKAKRFPTRGKRVQLL